MSDAANYYRQLRQGMGPDDRNQWALLIKELRATHGYSIYDAERAALLDPVWRRWVERQINGDERCTRMASSHMHYNGEASHIVEADGRLIVR